MKILLTALTALLLALHTCAQSEPSGWHGIVPLRSTRTDVIRILGPPNVDGKYYDIDNYIVHIDYSDGPCEKGKLGWNVPRDTVVSISLSPNHDLKFSDLQIDKKKLKKSKDGELPGIVYYTNDAEGITISVSEGEVRNIYYNPTSKDNHLRCPNSARNLGAARYDVHNT
jgi:hypothetical protein